MEFVLKFHSAFVSKQEKSNLLQKCIADSRKHFRPRFLGLDFRLSLLQ